MCVDIFAAIVKIFINFVHLLCVFFVLMSWEFFFILSISFGTVQFSTVKGGFDCLF